MKRVVGRFTVQGNEEADNSIISGPKSATNQQIDESGVAILIAMLTNFFNVEPRIYNPISINDIITMDSGNLINNSEGLESLYCRAFPHNRKSKDILFLKRVVWKLRTEKSETYAMNIINLIQITGYISYANIMEFGDFYFDQVPVLV